MPNILTLPRWIDAQQLRDQLAQAGWLTPDTYNSHIFGEITDQSAVYLFLLIERTEWQRAFVAYVGQSIALSRRLNKHNIFPILQNSDAWPMRWFLHTPAEQLRKLEREYIRRFNPPWNIIGRQRGAAVQ